MRPLASIILLLGMAVLSGCQSGAPGGCRMARATELTLHRAIGHMVLTAMLNGTPTTMVFDTGAAETLVTRAAAARLALNLEPSGFATGIGGSRSRYAFVAKTFQIGSLHGRHLNLAASDMNFSTPRVSVDGLLGDDFLAAYDVDLDLPDNKAILYVAFDGCTAPAAALSGSLYSLPMVHFANPRDHRPLVRVEVGGKTLLALIDSGAPGTVIFRGAARRLGLRLADLKTDRHVQLGGVGPNHPGAALHVITPLSIGDLTIRNMPAAIVDQGSFDDADMLLGLDFLSRVHVWYGFKAQALIMQYPAQPSPPAR